MLPTPASIDEMPDDSTDDDTERTAILGLTLSHVQLLLGQILGKLRQLDDESPGATPTRKRSIAQAASEQMSNLVALAPDTIRLLEERARQ